MSNRPGKRRLVVVGSNGAGPRLRFDSGQEEAFRQAADALVEEFAGWLRSRGLPGEPEDALLMLDWRFQYSDGVLDVWTVAHLSEFLLYWCPRKLSAPADLCAGMPATAAAFVEFLAHTGRLDASADRPSALRAWAERNQAAFLREMANRDNFGMAKSLFASAGALDGPPLDEARLTELTDRVNGLDPSAFDALVGKVRRQATGLPPTLGAVRMPDPEQRRDALRATALPARVRRLAEYCAGPGVALTGTGNLRLADARRLVDLLDTGDDVTGLRSAADLPGLDRVFLLALEAGAVRRHTGKLVSVAKFAALDDLAAHERIVHAALSRRRSGFGLIGLVRDALAEARPLLLAGLLHAGPEGLRDDDVIDLIARLVLDRLPGMAEFADQLIPAWLDEALSDLEELGVVVVVPDEQPCDRCEDPHWFLELAAAGVGPAVDLVRGLGVEVALRPNPSGASATELAALAGVGHDEDWHADLCEWLSVQADLAEGTLSLLTAVAGVAHPHLPMMVAIGAIEEAAPAHTVAAVQALLGGRCDGIAVTWLLERDLLDPAQVSPERLLGGLIDALALTLDAGGEEELAEAFAHGPGHDGAALLDDLWRADHPRLVEILDVLGARLQDRALAKRARRSAVKLRSRLAQQSAP
ncbi:MAG: hypothetical protein ACT4QG_08365 [Sporichthyaceae bacterium]